jgi:hypothetical protein
MERSVRIELGVVVERRRSTSPWQEWSWRPASVFAGAPPLGDEWRELIHGEGWTHYHAANLPLELHRVETEGYRVNLAQRPPRVFVVLRPAGAPHPHAYRPLLITASPEQAEAYLGSGDEIVEGVAMPEPVIAWLRAFVDRHHVEEPFIKRKRTHKGAAKGETGTWAERRGRSPNGTGSDG